MAVETNMMTASLLEKLKVLVEEEEPWIPPVPWESIPSESGGPHRFRKPQASTSIFNTTSASVSESSLVRLAMNALQGIESSLISIEKLSTLFCLSSADRTFHHIPSLWTRSSSSHALGNLLRSIGRFGCTIFLLHRFVNYFANPNCLDVDSGVRNHCLVNQSFAVAIGKVLEGYISALNTLNASVCTRRSSSTASSRGCLTSVGHLEITLLEVYLHTDGLRTQMEALGYICNVNELALGFTVSSFEDLSIQANSVFNDFPQGADLLTFLYMQLKVADPAHRGLLKFLFLRSLETYSGFLRLWIYEGKIVDPYKEFAVEFKENLPGYASGNARISIDSSLATVRARDGIRVPCFLEGFLSPILRAGQQVQIVMKLLELCDNVGVLNDTHREILPHPNYISTEPLLFASPLTYDKVVLEGMTLKRKTYYRSMMQQAESILTKLRFSSRQESLYGHIMLENIGKNLVSSESFVTEDGSVSLKTDTKLSFDMDSGASGNSNESFFADDQFDSSGCSSPNGYDEELESEQLFHSPHSNVELEAGYLSALSFDFSFSFDKKVEKQSRIKKPFLMDRVLRKMYEEKNENVLCSNQKRSQFNRNSLPLASGDINKWKTAETPNSDCQNGKCFTTGSSDNSFHGDSGKIENKFLQKVDNDWKINCMKLEPWIADRLDSTNLCCSTHASAKELNYMESIPSSVCMNPWGLKYPPTFLSMNPVLAKSLFVSPESKSGERSAPDYFDFSSVKDPCKEIIEKLSECPRHHWGSNVTTTPPAAAIPTYHHHDIKRCTNAKLEDNTKMSSAHSPSDLQPNNQETLMPTNDSSGSSWETLLGSSKSAVNIIDTTSRANLEKHEIPVDFAIKKCLWEEILLQYRYVSVLAIRLLEDGFGLQKHLLALRKYHFMEQADWADLFITSLWHNKYYVTEADKRIPEIQGVLELSIQRSSCYGDPHKDHLYVYMKEESILSHSASLTGIHSFDVLSLGYRVDWPVSIILTPGALKIYSDIFSFLIKVKLALLSLSDVWCSLKCLMQVVDQSHDLEVRELKSSCMVLTKTRHQLNHFVSALQQYVQSQLSHVSWCRFVDSLNHKVDDMMDLESVHMAYLNESLHICFLSNETRAVANIVHNILQSVMDLRSCVTEKTLDSGFGKGSLSHSPIDISKVLAIRRTFAKNLKDLYLCYLKSPKHRKFGLSCFWDYLNYNEYYSELL